MSPLRTRLVCLAATAAVFLFASPSAHAYVPEWVVQSATGLASTGRGIRTGDLNRDGRPDTVIRTSGSVYVVLTKSDCTLGTPSLLYSGTVSDVVLADFNGDGNTDIVVAETATNSLVAFAGNGDGTFSSPVITTLSIAPRQLLAGDFDGRGRNELLVRTNTGTAMAIFTSSGLQFSPMTSTPLAASPYNAVVADIDGDGKLDVLVGSVSPVEFQIFYGKGDGTFEAPVVLTSNSTFSADIVLADMNGDGRLDIVSCEFDPNTVTVRLNQGARSFAPPVSSEVRANTATMGNPIALAVLDANDDGKPDAVMLLANSSGLATLPGNGDGTFAAPQFTSSQNLRLGYAMAAGDFTGDGRVDVVTTAQTAPGLSIMRNAPGEVSITIRPHYPTISTGQTDVFDVFVYAAATISMTTLPTGSVTINDAGKPVGTGSTPSATTTTISVSGLALGNHPSVTAAFGGDSNFRAMESAPVSVNVVSEVTTATLRNTQYPGGAPPLPYGTVLDLSGEATSPIPGLTGGFTLYADGQLAGGTNGGFLWTPNAVAPGTHTFWAVYEGDATHPPAKSNVITQVFTKADPQIPFDAGSSWYAKYGTQSPVRIFLYSNGNGGVPSGNVRLYEGSTVLATTYADPTGYSGGMPVSLTVPVLPTGVHYLYIVYDGNTNYNAVKTNIATYYVLPNGAIQLVIRGDGSQLTINALYDAQFSGSSKYYVIHRRVNAGPWTIADAHALYPNLTEYVPVTGTVYSYFMEAFDSATNQILATSNIDAATSMQFTDDPLMPGMAIKAIHVQELLTGVNAFRAAAGLQPLAFPGIGAGGPVLALHITELQTALNQARAVLGSDTVVFNGGAAPWASVKAQQIQDLRDAIR